MEAKYRVSFKIPAHYNTRSVDIIGDFNSWKEEKLSLEDDDGDNIWWGETKLPSGIYHYQVLRDGSECYPDPNNPDRETFVGRETSVLKVGKALLTSPLIHDPQSIDYYCQKCFYLYAAFDLEKFRNIKLLLVSNDVSYSFNSTLLYHDYNYSYHYFHSLAIDLAGQDFLYYFELENMDKSFSYYGKNGLCLSEWEVEQYEAHHPGQASLEVPDWVREAIFYQIFPERFANGDASLNPSPLSSPGDLPQSDSFYGGDIPGIIQRFDHLKKLGVNAIYLNPVFKADTNHKYDTADYEKIDPHFGTKKDFDELLKKVHENGMHLLLDGVFNHTGTSHKAWKDIEKNREKSPYLDWYRVHKFPLIEEGKANYDCWWNFPSLPELNVEDNPEVWEYLLKIARKWIKEGSDGWRLDVPNEVDHSFWKAFRKAVKEIRPDAFILGEIWQDGRPWLQGDEFDSVMNYRFRDAAVEFFAQRKSPVEDLVTQLGRQIKDYPMQANYTMFNLLSSHDTARFYTVAGCDKKRLHLAMAFQFTYLGVPSIYYGEEIGLEGGRDPDNRRMMPWSKKEQDSEILGWYKDLIRIRKENPILSQGNISFFLQKDNILGFSRFDEQDILYILINNSDENTNVDITQYAGNGDFVDISKDYPLKRKKAYTLYANDFAILKKL